ncbi:MAG: hypothetical protein RBQ94_00835 [Methanimicrococcus sp.]|nr:hypothetical protein [Methanimicrococcus sp.]
MNKSKSLYLALLLIVVLLSGCIFPSGPANKNPAKIGEVYIYDGNESVTLYFGLDLSEPSSTPGYVFEGYAVKTHREGNTIHVTANLTNRYSYWLGGGQPGSGLVMSLGNKEDFKDGSEYKVWINNGTHPIDTTFFKYDGDFLIVNKMAPVEAIRIVQEGNDILAIAEIMARDPNPQRIDEQNKTFLQSDDLKKTEATVRVYSVNETPTGPLHRFTEIYTIGNKSEMDDGMYTVRVNNKNVNFEIKDGILYSIHPARVVSLQIIEDDFGFSGYYEVLMDENTDIWMTDSTFSHISGTAGTSREYEMYIPELKMRADHESFSNYVLKSHEISIVEKREIEDGVYYFIVNDNEAFFEIVNGQVVHVTNYTISEI